MKKYHSFVLYLFIATAAFSKIEEKFSASEVQRIYETRCFSKGKSPGWGGAARIYFTVKADSGCKKMMLEYVEEKLRHDADFWPQVVPLYLQLGGDPALVVELLPSFKDPKTVAVAQLYLMIQGESSGPAPTPIKNTSTKLKARLRHEGDFFVVSVENIDPKKSVLFVRENYSVLSVYRTDGIALPSNRNSGRGRVDEANLVVLRPGDCYEFKVSALLRPYCHPVAPASVKVGGWAGNSFVGSSMPKFLLGIDRTPVASIFDHDPIPLVVQFVYDPSTALFPRNHNPELLTPFVSHNNNYNARKVYIENHGIVASDPVSLTVSVPCPAEDSPIGGVWTNSMGWGSTESVDK